MDQHEVRRDWAEREGRFSPAYYAHIGPNEVSETLGDVLDHYVADGATVLEVGCGCGRHLEHLRRRGFENLTGVDINAEAFGVMEEHYPTLAERGRFHTGAVEDVVPEFETDAFDVVYAVETLQHIHPDAEWVFEELARVTGDLLITAENEGNGPERGRKHGEVSQVDGEFPLYHRDWKAVFDALGFAQLTCEPTSRDTIRVFRTT